MLLIVGTLLISGCVSPVSTPTAPPESAPTRLPPPSAASSPTSSPTASAENQDHWESVCEEARLWEKPVVTFTGLLEDALNLGLTDPAGLGGWLPARGFTLTAHLKAPNLLGDRRNVDIVQISPLYADGRAYDKDAVLVVGQAEPGRYQLIPLRDRWLDYMRGEDSLSVVDTDGNGQPELASLVTVWGHACCSSEVALYEWHGGREGRFVDVAQNVEPVRGCYFDHRCQDVWSWGSSNPAGAQSLVQTIRYVNWGGDECSSYQVTQQYTRTAGGFQAGAAEVVSLPPNQLSACIVGWADAAAREGRADLAVPLLAAALDGWSPAADTVWGPAAEDYFRLKLGVWYATGGQTKQSLATLQVVRDAPAHPEFDMASRLAAAYLAGYQPRTDADAGCVALHDAVRYALLAIPEEPSVATDVKITQAWGFAEPYLAGFSLDNNPFPAEFCAVQPTLDHLQVRFEHAIPSFRPASEADVTAWFREQGLPVAVIQRADLTGDGSDGWLVVLRTGFSGRAQFWAMVEGEGGWTALEVPGYVPPELDDFTTTLNAFSLGAAWPHVNLLQVGPVLTLFRLVRTPDGLEAEKLFNDWRVRSYELNVTTLPPQLAIQTDDGVATYVWQAGEKRFALESP